MISQLHGHALGSAIVLTLRTRTEKDAAPIFLLLKNYLQEFEDRFSRFLPHSELTQLNLAHGQWFAASPKMRDYLAVSNEMQRWSEGYYNPFVLPDLQRAGYFGSLAGSHGKSSGLDMRNRHASYSAAAVDIEKNMVRLPINTAFDSGGLGKGYALDEMADIIEARGITDYWISLGGDVTGRGTDDSQKPWQVTLDMIDRHPLIELGRFRTAIATSSTKKRRGENWHHIIDPSTGKPSLSDIEVVSVVAKNGILADICAKSLLLAGGAPDYWHRHQQIAAYINGLGEEYIL